MIDGSPMTDRRTSEKKGKKAQNIGEAQSGRVSLHREEKSRQLKSCSSE